MRLIQRRAENRKGKRTFKSQISEGAAFQKGTSNYLGDPYQGEGHISQLQHCRKAKPSGPVSQEKPFQSIRRGKNPHPLSLHINAFTRLRKINCVFMQCSICCCASLGKSTFLLLLQSFILIL